MRETGAHCKKKVEPLLKVELQSFVDCVPAPGRHVVCGESAKLALDLAFVITRQIGRKYGSANRRIMGFIVIRPILATLAGAVVNLKIYYRLRRANWGPEWWTPFRILRGGGGGPPPRGVLRSALGAISFGQTRSSINAWPVLPFKLAISTLDNGTWNKKNLARRGCV